MRYESEQRNSFWWATVMEMRTEPSDWVAAVAELVPQQSVDQVIAGASGMRDCR